MIKHLFTLHRNDGGYANVAPSGHSRADMWHDLANKIDEIEKQDNCMIDAIVFDDDLSDGVMENV